MNKTIEEIIKLLDHPKRGLIQHSNTNKVRYQILGLIEEVQKEREEAYKKGYIDGNNIVIADTDNRTFLQTKGGKE